MKKIIITTLLIASLFLTGCNLFEGSISATQAEELGYFTFPGTDWGITIDEMFSYLQRKQDDFQIEKKDKEHEKSTAFMGDYMVLDDKVTIMFEFFDSPLIETQTLRVVSWMYPEEYTLEEYEELCEKIKKGICKDIEIEEDSQVRPTESGDIELQVYSIKSVSKTSTLPDEMKEKYNSFIRNMYDNEFYKNPPRDYQQRDLTEIMPRPLSGLSVYFIKDTATNKGKVRVDLSGNGIASAKAYIRGYELVNQE